MPGFGGRVATLGYLFPSLRRRMRKSLYARGRKNKAAYVREIQAKLSGKS